MSAAGVAADCDAMHAHSMAGPLTVPYRTVPYSPRPSSFYALIAYTGPKLAGAAASFLSLGTDQQTTISLTAVQSAVLNCSAIRCAGLIAFKMVPPESCICSAKYRLIFMQIGGLKFIREKKGELFEMCVFHDRSALVKCWDVYFYV